MTATEALTALQPVAPATTPSASIHVESSAPATESFGDMIARGVADMEAKVQRADDLVHAFAVDDSIPAHQVTIALQEARLSVELAMQVRARLVEGYREIMNMQL